MIFMLFSHVSIIAIFRMVNCILIELCRNTCSGSLYEVELSQWYECWQNTKNFFADVIEDDLFVCVHYHLSCVCARCYRSYGR